MARTVVSPPHLPATGRLHVADVMSSPPVTVGPDATFKEIVEVLLEHDISAVPVIDDQGRPVGVVAEADLLSREAYEPERARPLQLVAGYFRGEDPQWLRKASGATARDVMTSSVHTARATWTVREAARRLLEVRVHRLVVVDSAGRAVGVVSRQDVLRQFAGSDIEITTAVRAVLDNVRFVPEDAHVDFTVCDGIVELTGDVHHPSDRAVVTHAVAAVPGVVGVASQLTAREPEPPAA